MIQFSVDGIPAAKGSKNPWGGEANPNVKPWQAAIASAAREAMDGAEPFAGPVAIHCKFWFPRPKSHYGTGSRATTLKDSAPWYVAKKPDIDKLLRAFGDALTGIAFRDDAQIASMHGLKFYGSPGISATVLELVDELPVHLQLERAAESAA